MQIQTMSLKAYETVWTNRKGSECCNAPIIDETNLCSACKEYALTHETRLEIDHEYAAWKAARAATGTRIVEDEDECPHDELDHGICMDCGQDRFDDLVSRADFLGDD